MVRTFKAAIFTHALLIIQHISSPMGDYNTGNFRHNEKIRTGQLLHDGYL